MLQIGLIREGKVPQDNRVALTPAQCKWLQKIFTDITVTVQHSPNRCYPTRNMNGRCGGKEDLSACNLLLGIKEVPVDMLHARQNLMFFPIPKITAL